MKFLIIGLGSIGQRHYRNLLFLGHSDIIVYRTGRGEHNFISEFEKQHNPRVFTDLNSAFDERPDVIFITNPTAFHSEFIRHGIKHRIRGIFVEKPIASSVAQIKRLIERARGQNTLGYVGYNFRFHPLLQKMKGFFDAGSIGRVISASVDMGEYLPDWHPWEDYRNTYPAKKELGGGVVLTQSHDIDYLYWFFGMPEKITAFGGTRTGLEVDVEDVVKAIFDYEDGKIVSLHMDFYKRPPRKIFEIMGTEGTLSWDYYRKELKLIPHKSNKRPTVIKEPKRFNRNDMFVAEIQHFINCVHGKGTPMVNFSDGLSVLEICESILRSMNKQK